MTEASESSRIPRGQRVAALALVAVGILVAIFPDLFARATGYYVLNDYAIDRTAKALERDQIAFLLVSSLKASLALIEGSSIGVGFDLEVGDIVQPVYDYVDFFWRIFLYAFLVLGFYQILLETGLLLLGVNVMGFGIALFAAGGVHSGVPPAVVQAGRRMLLLGLLVAYVAPVSVVVSEALNERYVRKLQDRHLDAMGEFRTHLERASAEFLALRSEFSLSDPGQSMESLRNRLTRIGDGVSQAFHTSLTAFLFYMLGLIFELIVFPLLSAYLLYVFTRWGFGRILTPAPIVLPSPRTGTA